MIDWLPKIAEARRIEKPYRTACIELAGICRELERQHRELAGAARKLVRVMEGRDWPDEIGEALREMRDRL
jgi:hypothetical protein